MATPLLQMARQRKIIYFAAIVVLFTVSLVHRKAVLEPMAFALQLRETARGEVELTSSAVRLMLTGSRGLAVTLLWYNAMDKQKRNEWHELELLVRSITKLQPYFITPWLYQSWNLSFNVAVECDRPRDKFYYVSRGLELLAEGERRNRGVGDETAIDPSKTVFPGNPDMRFYMGFFYQLKIGSSDEHLTMRSLLDLSTIDPVERNPDKFWTSEGNQKTVDLPKFARFCQKYPRLVRRLSEQLHYTTPELIVRFLQDNQDVPSRFKPVEKAVLGTIRQSELRGPLEQFPILPPPEGTGPDRSKYDLTSEAFDVFLVSRSWYEFAQKPLPPPNKTPGINDKPYDKMRYRVPKQMVPQLFRHYPPRAQVFIAETLEGEGWFDEEGWQVNGWFDALTEKQDSEFADPEGRFVIGRDAKYHSRWAWDKGHRMYRNYGEENGMYLPPAVEQELQQRAELCRRVLKIRPEETPIVRSDQRQGELGASLEAHMRLRNAHYYRQLANFDAFFYQSEAERDPITSAMRKYLFRAELMRKRNATLIAMLKLYEEAWPLYMHACFKFPRFAQVSSMQEDLYEIHQRYLRKYQEFHPEEFKRPAVWFAYRSLGISPLVCWPEAVVRFHTVNRVSPRPPEMLDRLEQWFAYRPLGVSPALSWPEAVVRYQAVNTFVQRQNKFAQESPDILKVVPFKKGCRGQLDRVQYYDGAKASELREHLFLWTQGAAVAMTPNLAATVSYPGQERFVLTRSTYPGAPVPSRWRSLIAPDTHRIVDGRLGLNR